MNVVRNPRYRKLRSTLPEHLARHCVDQDYRQYSDADQHTWRSLLSDRVLQLCALSLGLMVRGQPRT